MATLNMSWLTLRAGDIKCFPENAIELLLWAAKRFELVSDPEDRETSIVVVIIWLLKDDQQRRHLIRSEFQNLCDFFLSCMSHWVSSHD